MLDRILDFKNVLIENYLDVIIDIDSFVDCITALKNQKGELQLGKGYWSNYAHASLSSAFMQLTDYSLVSWLAYFEHANIISDLLGISQVSKEGGILELFVLHHINNVFDFGNNELQIRAVRATNDVDPKFLTDDSNREDLFSEEENKRLISNLKVVMKMRGFPRKEIWGDNDIIVTMKKNNSLQQFCVISCKTSLRERVYQSIFWAMHSRLEGIGKHVFVTADKGASGNSEIGNREEDNKAKKSRDVLESAMDRVYVLRNEAEVNRSQVIKDFNYLEEDLNNWAKDIAGNR